MTALEIVGLDPYCGFFHANVYGRPALALDLMEEFRPIVADSVVLNLIKRRMVAADDFVEGSGTYLTPKGWRIFAAQYSARLHTKIYHPLAGRALSYQKVLEVQARQLAKLIKGEISHYPPFQIK
jgi:CRISPR-associated protein Cas1